MVRPQPINVADGGNRQIIEMCKAHPWMMQRATFVDNFLLLPLRSCDMILGVQWLLPLEDLQLNFQKLTLAFMYQGQKVLLQANKETTRVVNAKGLDKMTHNGGQLFMIRVFPTKESTVEATREIHPGILALIEEFQLLFGDPKQLPPSRSTFDHKIPLQKDSNPINNGPYRYSSKQKDIIEQLVQEMLDQGIVQPSCSPYALLVVRVGKKDGSWRLFVDYRALNKITIKDKFPIPIIEELLNELGGSKVYTKLDLRSGYHQIRMAKEDVQKTAFRTHSGHFEYLVMPFGLTNAPSSFQGLMNHVFKDYLRKFILLFFDDILVYSQNIEEHLQHL